MHSTETKEEDSNNDLYATWKILRPRNDAKVDRMSSTDLAYIGDAVYELLVRSRTVWPPRRTSDLQMKVVAYVRGE